MSIVDRSGVAQHDTKKHTYIINCILKIKSFLVMLQNIQLEFWFKSCCFKLFCNVFCFAHINNFTNTQHCTSTNYLTECNQLTKYNNRQETIAKTVAGFDMKNHNCCLTFKNSDFFFIDCVITFSDNI